jgi:dienelactone hydrolase
MSLHYVSFPSLHDAPLAIGARLRLPQAATRKHPAILILHGSAGPSLRESGYADVLNEAGFVTLEPDQWAARGFLAAHPSVDAKRIGVMGFSFGGVATMLAATRAQTEKYLGEFAALMPVYPVCWTYNHVPGFEFRDLVDAPIQLVTGALDQYDNDPDAGPKLVASLPAADRARIRATVMAQAHHGFDMPGADLEVQDPFGNRGKGGPLTMRYNADATQQSHRLAVEFFTRALAR